MGQPFTETLYFVHVIFIFHVSFFYDPHDVFQIQLDLVYGHLVHDVHILRRNVNELIYCDRDKPRMRHAKHNLYP